MHGNNLQIASAMKIAVTLQSITTLMCLNISNNNIDDEVAGEIAVIIFHNTELQQLHPHENSLCAAGAIKLQELHKPSQLLKC